MLRQRGLVRNDRIVSVAALQVDVSTPDGEVVPFASRVNPQRLIPWGAMYKSRCEYGPDLF